MLRPLILSLCLALPVAAQTVPQSPAEISLSFAPVVRQAVFDTHPKMGDWLKPVFDSLSLEVLQKLNAKVVVEGANPRDVAQAQLRNLGAAR